MKNKSKTDAQKTTQRMDISQNQNKGINAYIKVKRKVIKQYKKELVITK